MSSVRGVSAARPEPRAAPSPAVLGMLVFISSEATFFLFLLISYISYRNENLQGPDASQALDVGRTAIFSVCLFVSSATIALAAARFRRRDGRGFELWLALTILLGLVFLLGQVWEFHDLGAKNVTLSRNLFGSTFFTLTGFHGLHVAIGLVLLGLAFVLARSGDIDTAENGAWRSIEYYWHFVDAVWVVIFSAVYLWSLA